MKKPSSTKRKPTKAAAKRNPGKKPAAKKAHRKAAAARKANPRKAAKKRTAKRNPTAVDAAAALSESFHGRPAETIREIEQIEHSRDALTDLGRLVSLTVWLDEDNAVEIDFKGVRLAAADDGGQLYFIGSQRLDLKVLGLDRFLPKDHITVGPVEKIVYHTSKAFHDFEPCEYEHEFAEEGGEQPTLNYDVHNAKCYLTGGSYHVRPEGVVN